MVKKKKTLHKRNSTRDQNGPTQDSHSDMIVQDVETRVLDREGGLRIGIGGQYTPNFCLQDHFTCRDGQGTNPRHTGSFYKHPIFQSPHKIIESKQGNNDLAARKNFSQQNLKKK